MKEKNHQFFCRFTVHTAYSSSCRPMYDGVSPHWKRERGSGERVCVCGRGALCHHQLHTVLTMRRVVVAARRAQRCAALRISTIQVSRPDHTKHVAAHVLWCQEKTHPVGRFPTSHRADPPQRRWMYNAVIFDLVKYVPHCCRRAAAPPRLQAMLCLMW